MEKFLFHQLSVGDGFDFVGPSLNSYFKRCTKISTRRYRSEDGVIHQVGSINVQVYHVEKASP